MNFLKTRWRLMTNLLLLSAILITSFQNCTHVSASPSQVEIPAGVEVVTE